MELRPTNGGFLRPFLCGWFIIEFLKGNGPEDSKQIDPDIGAPMTDMHFEYTASVWNTTSVAFHLSCSK